MTFEPATPHPRPWVVEAAAAAVTAVALAVLAGTVGGVESWVRFDGLIPRAARTTGATAQEVTDQRTSTAAFAAGLTAVQVILLLLLALLVVGLLRRRRLARHGTIGVMFPLALLCYGLRNVGGGGPAVTGTPFEQELSRLARDTEPAWETTLAGIASVVVIAGAVLAVVLLSTPPARRFFHRPGPVRG